MGELTAEQTADNMAAVGNATFAAFGQALKGSGVDANNEWNQALRNASALGTVGATVADNIRKLQADELIPAEVKQRRTAELYKTGELLIEASRNALVQSVQAVEAKLFEASKPISNADTTQRAMTRSELDLMIAAALPPRAPDQRQGTMLQTLMTIAKQRPEYAFEILSTYGEAKMRAAGEAEFVGALQSNIGRELARLPGGPPKAQAAKAALVEMQRLNVRGRIVNFHQAGKFRLDGVKPATGPDTIVRNVSTAPDPQVYQSKVRFKAT